MKLKGDGVGSYIPLTNGIYQYRLQLSHIADSTIVGHLTEHILIYILHIRSGEVGQHLVGLHRLLAIADGASVFNIYCLGY